MVDEDADVPAPLTARARARRELTDAITDAARRQLAEVGAPGLSLRAVARELGMVSSAIYRYFPSRDALLTALIIDAYDAVGAAAETAVAGLGGSDPGSRWMAVAHAVRGWALEHRHEYALIYGSPVPGYVAPAETADHAVRVTVPLLEILADASRAGPTQVVPDLGDLGRLAPDLDRLAEAAGADVARPLLVAGLAAWMQLFGMISFELYGHLHTVIDDTDAHFDLQCRRLATLLGLGEGLTKS